MRTTRWADPKCHLRRVLISEVALQQPSSLLPRPTNSSGRSYTIQYLRRRLNLRRIRLKKLKIRPEIIKIEINYTILGILKEILCSTIIINFTLKLPMFPQITKTGIKVYIFDSRASKKYNFPNISIFKHSGLGKIL